MSSLSTKAKPGDDEAAKAAHRAPMQKSNFASARAKFESSMKKQNVVSIPRKKKGPPASDVDQSETQSKQRK